MKLFYSFPLSSLLVFGLTCLMACTNESDARLTERLRSLQQAEQSYNSLSEAEQQKKLFADEDTLFRDSKAGASAPEIQGLCCLSDWSISLPQCKGEKDGFVSVAQDVYNAIAAKNAIWTDFEFFDVCNFSEDIPYDSAKIVNAIKSLNPECIKDKALRQSVIKYRDGVVWCILHQDERTEEKSPDGYFVALNEYILNRYFYNDKSVVRFDTLACSKLYKLDVDSTETANNIKLWKDKNLWWKSLIETNDFDKRCSLALQALHDNSFDKKWTLEVMMALMQSGEYSPLLPRLWRLWRTCCQLNFGCSKISVMPHYTFNRYNKMVYTAIIDYMLEHPDDKECLSCAFYVLFEAPLIRCAFAFGNEAILENTRLGLY